MTLSNYHPVLAEWFGLTFGQATDVQLQAWSAIAKGDHTLIAAPTGSGKTLAALLPCLDKLVKGKSAAASWQPGVRILYVTPLKALNNDIHQHLLHFIEEIESYAANTAEGRWPSISSAVRTGDTKASERAKILRRPPDVLVTTPESLYLLLTAEKGRSALQTTTAVIVDEIHGLAGDKRGAHLSLSLERLTALCPHKVQRIGVSATQKPLERIARFLGGWESALAEPRPVTIIESHMTKAMQVQVMMPEYDEQLQNRENAWTPIISMLMHLMQSARSVLLFVNSRRLCERLVLRLNDHTGYQFARAHHGSLARERRLEVEQLLKNGDLRCLVATSSLELGIDVGHVDLVLQLDPPPDAAAGIQRIGRAGHSVGDVSRGFIIVRSKGQLAEAAVLRRSIIRRDIAEIRLPQRPLDVLTQQVTAIVAAAPITVDALFLLVAGSECYRPLTRMELEAVLQVLSGFYPFSRPLLDWDRSSGLLTKRGNTAASAITGVGTIPQSSMYSVHHADSRIHLGELDEEYVHESRAGDVFQLGTSSWMMSRIEQDRVYVQEAPNRYSEIPFWRAEPGGRSVEAGMQLGSFIEQLEQRLELPQSAPAAAASIKPALLHAAMQWLEADYGLEAAAAQELIEWIRVQHNMLALPTARRIVIEHYKDLTNQQRIIIHNPFGRTLNRTWLLAIERQFEKMLPYKLYGNAKDNGIEIVVPDGDASWLQTIWHITPATVDALLQEAVTGSPMLAISFRRIAETSLLLSRSFTRTPLWQKRLRSEQLLKQALPYAEHFPYLQEAVQECLHLYLDSEGLKQLLTAISEGRIEIIVKETKGPSPFALQFLADYVNTQIYEGDGFSDATRLQLQQLSRQAAGAVFGLSEQHGIDEGIKQAEKERLQTLRQQPESPEAVYDLLKLRGDLTEEELEQLTERPGQLQQWLGLLAQQQRAAAIAFGEGSGKRWICAEEQQIYDDFPVSDYVIDFIISRYADHRLSFTDSELQERYHLTPAQAAYIIDRLLAMERIEQAPFAADERERIWTSAQIAKRLIRLTIEQARKQAQPAAASRWYIQMAVLQHAWPGTQLSGMDGLRAVIARMQGLYLPAAHWESLIFPARVTGYRKEDLDLLCASGEIIWLGKKQADEKEGKIAFFLADAKPLYMPYLSHRTGSQTAETKHPQLLALLQRSGASFLTRLARETGLAPSALLSDLMDLVWEGHISNDQFAPLRLQLQTKGKQLAKTGSGQGRWYCTSSLLAEGEDEAADEPLVPGHAHTTIAAAGAGLSGSVLHWTQHLLDNYGILSKELAALHCPYPWDELLPVLRQLEHWGIVTRGILVEDTSTLQFARREFIAALREPVPAAADRTAGLMIVSAVDPINPYGATLVWPQAKGASFARKSSNFFVFDQGRWRLWVENNGKRITDMSAAGGSSEPLQDADRLKEMLGTLLRRQSLRKLKIEQWNGQKIAGSGTEAERLLLALGAERDNQSLILWPSQLL